MKIKHIGFFLKDSILDAERVMDDLVGYCEMEHTKQGTIYHLQIVVDGEIVRCKDCKYWAELTFLVPPIHHCGRLLQQYKGISERVSFETDADDFCSRGVRR